ncbi:MAG: 3-deoxy-D-manno-octulosonic acid transferase [Victivallales bacterium]|jgi:3-deoxy-D-manno-octulosonic-acid transferase|nr:3-deoxy-D-manno-octulosonic acid transferase [Victivallales bacterium]
MLRFFYNLFLPIGFLFYLPGLFFKYRNRPGWKDTFGERFGCFTSRRIKELAEFHGAIWIHAVSVGEAVVALSLLRHWQIAHPERKFVLSTTTTTGQELIRSQKPDNTAVIFCPIDFLWMVRKTLKVIQPSMLVIFETEIWPNLVAETRKRGVPVALVNGRMSDNSVRGYRKIHFFFGPLLRMFNLISVQTEADAERYLSISPKANVVVAGNLKFDQKAPEHLQDAEYDKYFGKEPRLTLLAASTHPGEEELIAETFLRLKSEISNLKLVLVPRHVERSDDIGRMLNQLGLTFVRRSSGTSSTPPVDVLLADTTGEMLKLMKGADLVIMGKSLAGHDEGHNLIEPALLDKPIVTGHVLRNFRHILKLLLQENAVATVIGDAELYEQLHKLLTDSKLRNELGERAGKVIRRHAGAADRTIARLEELLSKTGR